MARKPVARFNGLLPASSNASKAARGSSTKRDTKPELRLRHALRSEGLRGYRVDYPGLPGRPDVVFPASKVVVFCDGDFWHGRNLEARIRKLADGHNAPYWVKKISGNVARDRRHDETLTTDGWRVLRYWESEVHSNAEGIAREVARAVVDRSEATRSRTKRKRARRADESKA